MILTFEIFGRVRNHGKKFLKLCQTSFSGIVYWIDEVHSLYSEHLVLNPTLKSFPSQFSPFVSEITNACHALQNNACPKSRQKGESTKTVRLFSFPHARMWSVKAVQRSVSTCSEYSEQTLPKVCSNGYFTRQFLDLDKVLSTFLKNFSCQTERCTETFSLLLHKTLQKLYHI